MGDWDPSEHPRGESHPGTNKGSFIEAGAGQAVFDGKHVQGGGLWQAPGDSHGRFPPRKILAAYTDKDGYTVRITGGLPKEIPELVMGVRRYGVISITHPDGRRVRNGLFMNFPEREWNLSEAEYHRLSWERRAALEVHQQATAYKPLREQFEFALERQ